VAAMLSADHVFASASGLTGPQQQQQTEGRQGDAARRLQQVAAQAQGDHLLLLSLYQLWAAAGFSKEFVRSHGLDLRGMNFAREVRKQLAGAPTRVGGGWRERGGGLASRAESLGGESKVGGGNRAQGEEQPRCSLTL